MVFIYVLKLEQEKYYIGKTNNPKFRLESHFYSNGSEWTKLYKPLKLVEIKPDCDDYDEDKITIQYMDKYGINNVRGGSFCLIKLNKSTINTLNRMISGTNNKCFICEKVGHFAKNCPQNKYQNINNDKNYLSILIVFLYNIFLTLLDLFTIYENNNVNRCFRCGRTNHNVSSCYVSTHVNGYYLKHSNV